MLTVNTQTTVDQVYSACLKRTVDLEIYLTAGIKPGETLNLLLLNDGQHAEAMQLQGLLDTLYEEQKIEALLVVAIKSGEERLKEYGVAGVPDYLNRGAEAAAYAQFITLELLPYLTKQASQAINGKIGFAGFSLGGLSAFDIVYNHPDVFNLAGVFSGSFWWRKKDLQAGYQEDMDRILHQMVRYSTTKPDVKFWLMAGTAEETADRNGNCIIDAVDDTTDLVKELADKGFQRYEDLFYYEMVGGKHEMASWTKAFPAFLTWSFPKGINKKQVKLAQD